MRLLKEEISQKNCTNLANHCLRDWLINREFEQQIRTANSHSKFAQQIRTANSIRKFEQQIRTANSNSKFERQIQTAKLGQQDLHSLCSGVQYEC